MPWTIYGCQLVHYVNCPSLRWLQRTFVLPWWSGCAFWAPPVVVSSPLARPHAAATNSICCPAPLSLPATSSHSCCCCCCWQEGTGRVMDDREGQWDPCSGIMVFYSFLSNAFRPWNDLTRSTFLTLWNSNAAKFQDTECGRKIQLGH